ncbi:McrC family protein [Halobacillus sp. Nhm2S1]|nr:McrC family protein [Halobacillus sp. Nhm2S1]
MLDYEELILQWKILRNQPRKNYGISQSDMYQMYAYSKKYNTPEIWLLYPLTDEMDSGYISFYSNKNEDIETIVRVFFVDVSNIEESLEVLKEKLILGK